MVSSEACNMSSIMNPLMHMSKMVNSTPLNNSNSLQIPNPVPTPPPLSHTNPNVIHYYPPNNNSLFETSFSQPSNQFFDATEAISIKNSSLIEQNYNSNDCKNVYGWSCIDGAAIPYIIRDEKKYVAVRMVENKILLRYPNVTPNEIKHNPLVSHYVTQKEAALLNQINAELCSREYGLLPFTNNDLIVKINDFEEFLTAVKRSFSSLNHMNHATPILNSTQLSSISSSFMKPNYQVANTNYSNAVIQQSPIPQFTPQSTPNTSQNFLNKPNGGWLQVNNTVVPYIWKTHDRFLPISVIKYAANLLLDVDVHSINPSKIECILLNEMCKNAGLNFSFALSTQMVALKVIQMNTNQLFVLKDLPKDNPFNHADYIDISDENSKVSPQNNLSNSSLNSLSTGNSFTDNGHSEASTKRRRSGNEKCKLESTFSTQDFIYPLINSINLKSINSDTSPISQLVNTQINSNNPQMNSLKPQMNSANPHMNSANPHMNSASPHINSANPHMNDINSQMNYINPQMNHINPQMNSCNLQMNSSNLQMDSINPQMNSINQHIHSINPQINSINAQMTSNSSLSNNLHTNLIDSNVNSINPHLNSITPCLNSNDPHFNAINPHLNSINTHLNAITSDLNSSNTQINNISPQMHSFNPQMNPTNTNSNSLNLQNSNLNTFNSLTNFVDPLANSSNSPINIIKTQTISQIDSIDSMNSHANSDNLQKDSFDTTQINYSVGKSFISPINSDSSQDNPSLHTVEKDSSNSFSERDTTFTSTLTPPLGNAQAPDSQVTPITISPVEAESCHLLDYESRKFENVENVVNITPISDSTDSNKIIANDNMASDIEILPIALESRVLSCIEKSNNMYALVEAVARVFFPSLELNEFVNGIQNTLGLNLLQLTPEEESAYIKFYKLPTSTLKCNRVVKLTDFKDNISRLRYMFNSIKNNSSNNKKKHSQDVICID